MRKLVLTALAATFGAAGFAAPALAQSTGPFDGPRIGVIAGYDGLRPGRGPASDIGSNNGADGFLYGAEAGYDHQMGRFVLGAEGEVAGSTAKADNDPMDPQELGYGRVKAGRDLYAGVRAGYLVTPTTMIYAKGGYTNARLDLTHNDGTTNTGEHFNLDGYRVGAGVEQAIGRNTYAKVEYRYSNYGDARLEYANGANTNNFDVNTDRHQVVAGVGFRF
ncbi:porin family protein [Sphingomonas koreensis]|nr:porin family protein [Sphingomonas koreensis]